MNTLVTRSGQPVHPIGIGTWEIGSHINPANVAHTYRGVEPVYGNEDAEIAALRYSLAKGQNHIHCAELYGGFYTDEIVGRAISGAPREDLFVADTLWKCSVGKGKVRPTVEKMLAKLGTDYLDLLYIHAPWDDAPWQEAIPQIDELIDEGIVGHFGVSNFTVAHMMQANRLAKHPLVANQIHYNVLDKQNAGPAFLKYCKAHNVQIVAYQPLKRQAVLQSKVVQDIAKTHNATPAQVALAWLLQGGAWPIPKAIAKAHIDENMAAAALKLTTTDVQALNQL